MTSSENELVIYVDVDDTLIRSVGAKIIPISSVVEQVASLHKQGAIMYCWSSGGAKYAERIAKELNMSHCFEAFLPKPNYLIDDMSLLSWRYLKELHPNECQNLKISELRQKLFD